MLSQQYKGVRVIPLAEILRRKGRIEVVMV